jgi:Domain of unknown function (DUF6456)
MTTASPSAASESMRLPELLLQLGRPGAYLVANGNGNALKMRGSAIVVPIPARLIDTLRGAHHLTTADPRTGLKGEILSAAGRDVLRRILMTAELVSDRQPKSQNARAPRRSRGQRTQDPAAGSNPERPLERRSVLEQLRLRKDGRGVPLLADMQFAAGQRFAAEFERAQMQPNITAKWGSGVGRERRRRSAPGVGVEIPAAIAAAQARVRAALADLGGTLAEVVLDVCAFDQGLEAIEAKHGWPARTARIVLQAALERLALHFGMIIPQRTGSAGVRKWGDGAHRPSAEAWLKQ